MVAQTKQVAIDRSQVLTKAVLNAAECLGLNQAVLATVLGISTASVSRMRAGSYLIPQDSKAWELASLLVRLFRGLDAIMAGDEKSLRAWMRNPNTDLHAAPETLVIRAAGLVNTVEYVDAYRARV